jgi:DNA-binding FadR family transcriptional regulator
MALFSVGRSTIREAVRVLAHDGILTVRQGDGTYVRPAPASEPLDRRIRRSAILEVYEVRHALEVEAARLAAERRDDVAFHVGIAIASKKAILADLYREFTSALRTAIAAEVRDEVLRGRDSSKKRQALLRAIENQDPAGAVNAVHEIVDWTTKQLRADIAQRRSAPPAPTRPAGRPSKRGPAKKRRRR